MGTLGVLFLESFLRFTPQGQAARSQISYVPVAIVLGLIVGGFVFLSHMMDVEKARKS